MWLASNQGVTQSLGVAISGSLSPHWLYPRLVWGGLWGLLFLLPMLASSLFARSLVIALIPTLVQLFVIYPVYEHRGVAGMSLGALTPFVVFFFYWVWAFVAALALRLK